MGRWTRGFEAGEKSFVIVQHNRNILYYILATSLIVLVAVLSVFYFKPESESINAVLKIAEVYSFVLLIFISSIWIIYHSLAVLNIKRTFSFYVALLLLLWIACELIVRGAINYFIPKEGLSNLMRFFWDLMTLYVPVIIIFNAANPLSAIAESIKTILTIFIESLSLGIFFLFLTFILGLPFLIGLLLDYIFANSKLIPDVIRAIEISLAWALGLVRVIGQTILYLYYKKELPPSYLEK